MKKYLCRDINGDVHIVDQSELVLRTSVYAIIQDDNGLLLVRDRTCDEKWDLPGGGVESEEEIIDALRREVEEETKLQIVGEPEKICEFTEYFYDVGLSEGWESTRHFYKIVHAGTPFMDGNDDDIIGLRYFKQPFPQQEVAPVARKIFEISSRN